MSLNQITQRLRQFGILFATVLLCSCGFHLRGDMPLASPLHTMYIQSSDPYGTLVRNLTQSLKLSGVHLTENPDAAQTIMIIQRDQTSQKLLSVGATQQTRQYQLMVVVVFEVTDTHGRVIVEPQALSDTRVITVQSNQILGSSNEANLYYQQMRRSLASAIMYRLSSHQVTDEVNKAFNVSTPQANTKTSHSSKKRQHETKPLAT